MSDAAFDDKRVEELATGFALGELKEDELKELYEYLRNEQAEEVAAITWSALASSLDLKMKLSPHFADTIRHRIEHDDDKADDAFAGGILQRLGVRRKQLDPVNTAEQKKHPLPGIFIIIPAILLVVIIWLLLPDNSPFPVVRHVSGGKVFQEGDGLVVDQQVDQRQIAIGKGGKLILEWPTGDQVSVQGPATILVQHKGMSVVNGIVWLQINPDFTLGLPDQHMRSNEASRIAVKVENSVSVVGVESGKLVYGDDDGKDFLEINPGQALWNGQRDFQWHYSDATGIATSPVNLGLDPIAANWSCSFKVALADDDSMLICKGLDERAEEMILNIHPMHIEAEKNNNELWRYNLQGAPRSPRRVTLEGKQGSATVLTITGLDKKIQWHLHAPLDSLEMKGAVALSDLRYRTGPPPIPDNEFVNE